MNESDTPVIWTWSRMLQKTAPVWTRGGTMTITYRTKTAPYSKPPVGWYRFRPLEIWKDVGAGVPYSEIAAKWGITESTLKQLLKQTRGWITKEGL